MQKIGLRHGLLKEVIATKPCGKNCACAEVGDFPQTCYRKTYK